MRHWGWAVCGVVASVIAAQGQTVDLTWDPGLSQGGTEAYTTNSPTGSYYFRVTSQTTAQSVGYWRTVLRVESGEAHLYLRQGALPTTSTYDAKSDRDGTDEIARLLTPGQEWYILVEATSTAQWRLWAGDLYIEPLNWDSGTTEVGTGVGESSALGEDHYYRLVTENADLGMWRTALKASVGDAGFYMKKDAVAVASGSLSSFTYASNRVGDDGMVLPLSNTTGAGQIWYFLVKAEAGASWSLSSGDVYVTDLGSVAADGSSGSGLCSVPAEGVRYFRTTVPLGALAWRLWLQDAAGSNTVEQLVMVRKGLAPNTSQLDRQGMGQLLVVPSFLEPGGTTPYYVGIQGDPGMTFQLDSRRHQVETLAYGASVQGSASGFHYKTYRVDVPPDLIAWDLLLSPRDGTDPQFAVHYGQVPNETDNVAFSELESVSKNESITLVPPSLSEGSYYITVYGEEDFSYTLSNQQPTITQTDYVTPGWISNDDVNRAGWKYYAVTDINQQLGSLGWLLQLGNQIPGTQLSIRRNNVPGQWSYRTGGSLSEKTVSYADRSSVFGVLQDPAHAADVWYVGVYMPTAALGAFQLSLSSLQPTDLAMDGDVVSESTLYPKTWMFYQVDIDPTGTNGNPVLGWEARVSNWGGISPKLVVRRGLLPVEAKSSGKFGLGSSPQTGTAWDNGSTWLASGGEWTGYSLDYEQSQIMPQTILSMAMGRPLEPGRYYIGIYNDSSDQACSFTLKTKAVGSGMGYDMGTLPFDGSIEVTGLDASDLAYFKVEVPINLPNWKVKLENGDGESMLLIRRDYVPTWAQDGKGFNSPGEEIGKLTRLQKSGDEYFVLFPENTYDNKPSGEVPSPFIPAGTYYCMVVSEGNNPTPTAIGNGSISATLRSLGAIEADYLGILEESPLIASGSFAAGEIDYLKFDWGGGTGWYTVNVESSNEWISSQSMITFPPQNDAGGTSRYGGMYSGYEDTAPPENLPYDGSLHIVLSDRRAPSMVERADYEITVSRFPHEEILFDGSEVSVTGLCGSVVYEVVVPPNAEGWELRLTEWSGSRPSMTVSYGSFPDPYQLGKTRDITPASATNWNYGAQWAVSSGDWTGLVYDSSHSQQHPQYVMSMGRDRPLMPGIYYICFNNPNCETPANFTFTSRGIGAGFAYSPISIAFNGGQGVVSDLPARDVQYFTVDVPEGKASWRVKLENVIGESSLYIREGYAPTTTQKGEGFHSPGKVIGNLTRLQKEGDEHFVLLPEQGEQYIPSGTNYLMVVSLGVDPTATDIGAGSSSAVLHSLGEATVIDLGALPETGEIVYSNQYATGEAILCQFTVPEGVRGMEARILEATGYPMLHLSQGSKFIAVNSSVSTRYAGLFSENDSSFFSTSPEVVTVSAPSNGVWSVLICDPRAAANLEGSAFSLSILTLSTESVAFHGGVVSVTNLPPNNWLFFDVEVPYNDDPGGDFLGWELRMTDWNGGTTPPYMVVRRNALPDGITTHDADGKTWRPANSLAWPQKYQWATKSAPYDWSLYRYSAGRLESYPEYILSMAKERPLEGGSYLIGVYNSSATETCSFQCESRVIGGSMADYAVQTVGFYGGVGSISNLAVRGVAYFKVTVPEGVPSWNVQLDNESGESMLFIRKDYVPTWEQSVSSLIAPDEAVDKLVKLKKTGDEHYTLLPKGGEPFIPAGDYYLMVVSEGVNPTSTDAGSGVSSATLRSLGVNPVTDMGTLIHGEDVTASVSYDAGDLRLLQFGVDESVVAMELRLTDQVGAPNLSLSTDEFPKNYGGVSGYYGGMFAASNPAYYGQQIITIPNVQTGWWSLILSDPNTAANLQNGSCTLTISSRSLVTINGDTGLNTNGQSNVAAGSLVDNQRAYYQVTVPEYLDGEPVLGWYLTAGTSQGSLSIRSRLNALPEDGNRWQTGWGEGALMVVPPLLTPGVWYVEVKATGATVYTLSSSLLTTPKRTWTMPALGEPLSTPGVASPLFGDTGVNEDGSALPGDQGIDLGRGLYDLYAVTVPTNNAGLLSVRLEAISGNPDIYARHEAIPTINHDLDASGYFYDRILDGTAFTQYGNWVPLDGRTESELASGKWFLLVKAEGESDARYRLKMASGNVYTAGNVQEMELNAGTVAYAGQTLARGDWRYYRVDMPDPVPYEWTIHFSQTQGDVDLFVRDTVPPGTGVTFNEAERYQIDWRTDDKMAGVEPYFPNVGSNTIRYDLLKPGKTYYVGVMAKLDATFSIGSTTNAEVVPSPIPIDFYTGFYSNTIPANQSVTFQIDVPENAVRWMHSTTNASAVQVYLKQGGWPTTSVYDYRKTNGTGSLSQFLFEQPWPWLTGESYFMTVTNTSAISQPFTLVMSGSSDVEIPSSLVASDGTYADYIRLSWSGVSGATSYSVYRSVQNDPQTAELITTTSSTSWNDTEPERGIINYYWVSVMGASDLAWFSTSDGGWLSGEGVVTPSAFNLPYEETNITVNVDAAEGLLWGAYESLSWVTILEGAQSSGDGMVRLRIVANPLGNNREGTVVVAGQNVTIVQEGFGVPQNVQASDQQYNDRVVITWDLMPSAAYRYYVRRAIVDDIGTAVDIGYISTNQFIDVSVTPDQSYFYWVRPRLVSGYGSWSDSDQGSPRTFEMIEWIDQHFGENYLGDEDDPDMDGYINIAEFIAGTDPTNNASFFSPVFLGVENGYIYFDVPASMNNRLYDIQWVDSLDDNEWNDVGLDERGFGGAMQLRIYKGEAPSRFFRPTVRME